MLSTVRNPSALPRFLTRGMATQTRQSSKKEGDISSVFVSLSTDPNAPPVQMPERFASLKRSLMTAPEALDASWKRLLRTLREEIPLISARGSSIIPCIDFADLKNPSPEFISEHEKRGVAIIRNVVRMSEARQWKHDVESYISKNKDKTKAFPPHDPQVYELYWSPSQIAARSHPNMLASQKFLLQTFWTSSKGSQISLSHPTTYADRLRIRQPGDATFALGPHVDGGSLEQWEPEGYGRTDLYSPIFEGRWEDFDPWDASNRVGVVTDLYNGAGACSMLRCYQGWLAMSETGPGEGSLLVNPLLAKATAYYLLRPFFVPRNPDAGKSGFLDEQNWMIQSGEGVDSVFQGAAMGYTQELNEVWHPHLQLEKSMVNVPAVRPGDYVVWHCDGIHAVDKMHKGNGDSSVMYIPVCPLTEANAEYLKRQREAFLAGTPGPDFPGGKGESEHVGRPAVEELATAGGEEGMKAFGLKEWTVKEGRLDEGEKVVLDKANRILFG